MIEDLYARSRYQGQQITCCCLRYLVMFYKSAIDILYVYPPGTTWLKQITCLLLEQDVSGDIRKAVPIVEFSDNKPPNRPMSQIIEEWPSPRILATHLLPHFFDNNLKDSSPLSFFKWGFEITAEVLCKLCVKCYLCRNIIAPQKFGNG